MVYKIVLLLGGHQHGPTLAQAGFSRGCHHPQPSARVTSSLKSLSSRQRVGLTHRIPCPTVTRPHWCGDPVRLTTWRGYCRSSDELLRPEVPVAFHAGRTECSPILWRFTGPRWNGWIFSLPPFLLICNTFAIREALCSMWPWPWTVIPVQQ